MVQLWRRISTGLGYNAVILREDLRRLFEKTSIAMSNLRDEGTEPNFTEAPPACTMLNHEPLNP